MGSDIFFTLVEPKSGFGSFIDSNNAAEKVRELTREYAARSALRENGMEPTRKILVSGPAGSGKSLFAEVLAKELGLRLALVQNCGILRKGPDEAAKAFSDIFKWLSENPAVYLFEHMWLPKEKGILDIPGLESVFFQLLKMEESDSIILVESCHFPPGWQSTQFDAEIRLENSGHLRIREILETVLKKYGKKSEFIGKDSLRVADGLPNSSIARACRKAIRKSVIDGAENVSLRDLEAFFRDERTPIRTGGCDGQKSD